MPKRTQKKVRRKQKTKKMTKKKGGWGSYHSHSNRRNKMFHNHHTNSNYDEIMKIDFPKDVFKGVLIHNGELKNIDYEHKIIGFFVNNSNTKISFFDENYKKKVINSSFGHKYKFEKLNNILIKIVQYLSKAKIENIRIYLHKPDPEEKSKKTNFKSFISNLFYK